MQYRICCDQHRMIRKNYEMLKFIVCCYNDQQPHQLFHINCIYSNMSTVAIPKNCISCCIRRSSIELGKIARQSISIYTQFLSFCHFIMDQSAENMVFQIYWCLTLRRDIVQSGHPQLACYIKTCGVVAATQYPLLSQIRDDRIQISNVSVSSGTKCSCLLAYQVYFALAGLQNLTVIPFVI